jgi:hypothetical protein
MIIITSQVIYGNGTLDISCDSKDIFEVLSLLEDCPNVKAYKITVPSIGVLNDKQLQYSYNGFRFPAGKAVEKFDWKSYIN